MLVPFSEVVLSTAIEFLDCGSCGKLLKEDEGEEKDEEKEVEARKALKVHVLMGDRTCLGRTSQQVRKNIDLLQCLLFPI